MESVADLDQRNHQKPKARRRASPQAQTRYACDRPANLWLSDRVRGVALTAEIVNRGTTTMRIFSASGFCTSKGNNMSWRPTLAARQNRRSY